MESSVDASASFSLERYRLMSLLHFATHLRAWATDDLVPRLDRDIGLFQDSVASVGRRSDVAIHPLDLLPAALR